MGASFRLMELAHDWQQKQNQKEKHLFEKSALGCAFPAGRDFPYWRWHALGFEKKQNNNVDFAGPRCSIELKPPVCLKAMVVPAGSKLTLFVVCRRQAMSLCNRYKYIFY